MKYIFSFCIAVLFVAAAQAQYPFRALITDNASNPLPGSTVSIPALHRTAIADTNGIAHIRNIPAGIFEIRFSHVGYAERTIRFFLSQNSDSLVTIVLESNEEPEEDIIVTATRSGRSIANIPTRVETISGDELAEKGNMKPGDIRMMLNESTGIQTQQTSATSYNSSIRIQGLDGRYTQLLKDGFPLYAGFSGGLSLMQVAPLDLKQVEVIKGSSSTLFGGGAIAGLVNLVSKVPGNKREISFIMNATSAAGLDISGFFSQRFGHTGLTVFASGNTAKAYDPSGIGLTAIPEYKRYTLNPRFFIYSKRTNANIGLSYITEKRLGGSMAYIRNGTAGYFERNKTGRFTGQAEVLHKLNETDQLTFKTSYTGFNRMITIPAYIFEARQRSTYSELNFLHKKNKIVWNAGINFLTEDLHEIRHAAVALRDYRYRTAGLFMQQTWSPDKRFSLESGMRIDHVDLYGFEWLPRLSALYRLSGRMVLRLGGGLGYKTPTVFNEEAEKIQFQDILPVDKRMTINERSSGGSLDLNYQVRSGRTGFAFNHLFFYTKLNRPLILTDLGNDLAFRNEDGYIDTKGMETNIRLTYHDFKLFIGYTYADVNNHFSGTKTRFPLTAKHRLNNVLIYEVENKIKVGAEAYYFDKQLLSDGTSGKPYWLCGLMCEKFWKQFSVFINFENLFDVRQTRFDHIYTGSISNPVFRDIYAPVDGFVVNGGLKLKL